MNKEKYTPAREVIGAEKLEEIRDRGHELGKETSERMFVKFIQENSADLYLDTTNLAGFLLRLHNLIDLIPKSKHNKSKIANLGRVLNRLDNIIYQHGNIEELKNDDLRKIILTVKDRNPDEDIDVTPVP